jgi:hypothetical protein
MTTVPTSTGTTPQSAHSGTEVGILAIFGGIMLTGTRKWLRK